MSVIEQQIKEWLKSLNRKDRAMAKRGMDAGRVWGESGRSYDAVAAVIAFADVHFSGEPEVSEDGLLDSTNDHAYDHFYRLMTEAVGDDEEFDAAMEEGAPFQTGWFLGIGRAYAEMKNGLTGGTATS